MAADDEELGDLLAEVNLLTISEPAKPEVKFEFWSQLPPEIVIKIIEGITDIQQIFALRLTSNYNRDLVHAYVVEMTSPDLTQTYLKYLQSFQRLRKVTNIMLRIEEKQDAEAITGMFNLSEASFLFTAGLEKVSNLANMFLAAYIQPIELVDGKGQKTIIQRKLMDWQSFNFGFYDLKFGIQAVVLGRGRGISPTRLLPGTNTYNLVVAVARQSKVELLDLGPNTGDALYAHNVDRGQKKLTIIDNYSLENMRLPLPFPLKNRFLRYLDDDLLQFIQRADFGLANPSQQPSSTNPALIWKLPVTKRGISTWLILIILLFIYIFYIKRFVSRQKPDPDFVKFVPDKLIEDYLVEKIRDPTKMEVSYSYTQLVRAVRMSTMKDSIEDFHTFVNLQQALAAPWKVDMILSKEKEALIVAASIYGNKNIKTIYLPDGSSYTR